MIFFFLVLLRCQLQFSLGGKGKGGEGIGGAGGGKRGGSEEDFTDWGDGGVSGGGRGWSLRMQLRSMQHPRLQSRPVY